MNLLVKCPKCGSANVVQAAEGVFNCQDCYHYFSEVVPKPLIPPPALRLMPLPALPPPVSAAEKIRGNAREIVGLSVFLLILGMFITVSTLCHNLASDTASNSGYIAVAGLISLAVWLYLIGQVVHIRALLAKE